MPNRFLACHSPNILKAAQHKANRVEEKQHCHGPIDPLRYIADFGCGCVGSDNLEPRLLHEQESYQDQPEGIDRKANARALQRQPRPE